jgi:hypothetical protein
MAAAAAATAAAAAAAGSDAAAAAAAAAAELRSTAALSQRIEAGIAMQQARQLLQDAGILQLPTTLLAWEDEDVEPEPAMQLHRGLLPPNHERPERLMAVLARLRAAGLLGELPLLLLFCFGCFVVAVLLWVCCCSCAVVTVYGRLQRHAWFCRSLLCRCVWPAAAV